MTKTERDKRLGKLGKAVALVIKLFEPNFHGFVRFNVKAGNYVNANVEETIKA